MGRRDAIDDVLWVSTRGREVVFPSGRVGLFGVGAGRGWRFCVTLP